MKKTFRLLAVAATLGLLAAPVFANHCPMDMAEIDAALAKNPMLTADKAAEVKKLRADGETLHKAGKHQESMDALAKAKGILGLK